VLRLFNMTRATARLESAITRAGANLALTMISMMLIAAGGLRDSGAPWGRSLGGAPAGSSLAGGTKQRLRSGGAGPPCAAPWPQQPPAPPSAPHTPAAVFMEAEKFGPNRMKAEYKELDFHEALYWATITLTSEYELLAPVLQQRPGPGWS
jgi:hypothetical protein